MYPQRAVRICTALLSQPLLFAQWCAMAEEGESGGKCSAGSATANANATGTATQADCFARILCHMLAHGQMTVLAVEEALLMLLRELPCQHRLAAIELCKQLVAMFYGQCHGQCHGHSYSKKQEFGDEDAGTGLKNYNLHFARLERQYRSSCPL